MARILVSSYAVRFPLGGYLSWVLQWLVGLDRLGHEVYFIEKGGWAGACYDPIRNLMSDDCSYGTRVLNDLLARFGLQDQWCFLDVHERCYGLSRERLEQAIHSADLFIDLGRGGTWKHEVADIKLRVFVDGDPGVSQMQMETWSAAGKVLPIYNYYYTVGRSIATGGSTSPTAGKQWRPLFFPVLIDVFGCPPAKPGAAFTTIMSWQANNPIQFDGKTYGGKDIEFARFMDLPGRTACPLEVAVGGDGVPVDRLRQSGWRVQDAHQVTLSFDLFRKYICESRGEFSVCKNAYVATHSGWFGDRGGAYLASGRPVVQQETGFSEHLPCGRGLFAVRTAEEAAAAIEEIDRDCERHSRWAREIAVEYLDAAKVLGGLLSDIGI